MGCNQPTTFRTLFFLNCVRRKKNPYTCACWMPMLAVPTLTSAEQEFHLLLPPSSQSPRGYLCTVPSACSLMCPLPHQLGLGERGPPFLLPGKWLQCRNQPKQAPPQNAVQAYLGHAGATRRWIQWGSWQVIRLQASIYVGKRQQDQAHKRQCKLGYIYHHTGNWLLHCHVRASGDDVTHAFTQVLWPYYTIGLFL